MVRWSNWAVLAVVMAAAGIGVPQNALCAVGHDTAEALTAAAAAMPRADDLPRAVDLQLHFIQEGGPDSGQVRVVVTPESRPLTILEARSAAQKAFLQALSEPGLGSPLRRVTVVVRLLPRSHPDPGAAAQVIRFQHKSGRDWSVTAGE